MRVAGAQGLRVLARLVCGPHEDEGACRSGPATQTGFDEARS